MAPERDRVVTSDTAPAFISIPFMVSFVMVDMTPVAVTVNASAVPEVSVPEASRFPVISVLSFKERFESESEIAPVRVNVPVSAVLSERVIVSAPAFITIFPVLVLPIVRVCLFVVPKVPSPLR